MVSKKIVLTFSLIFLVLFQIVAISALSASQAKQDWQDAKEETAKLKLIHNEAKAKWMGNKSNENVQSYVDTGKEFLQSTLNEAEAWLIWKQQEVEQDEIISEQLKIQVQEDINKNLAKIEELRGNVEGATTKVSVDLFAVGMVVGYLDLLTDVARDSGLIWVEKLNQYIDTIESYESSLRETAQTMENNQEVLNNLDLAKESINEARENINKAELSYQLVVQGGTPLIKFNEGNQYIRTAKANMLSANNNLKTALGLIK